MTDKKTAQAELTKAEKTFAAAHKKALTAQEKFREAARESNLAARALQAARVNPLLFDDDDLSLVDPNLTYPPGPPAGQRASHVIIDETHTHAVPPSDYPREHVAEAGVITEVHPGTSIPVAPEQEPEYVQDAEGYAEPVAPTSAAPWEQPVAAPPAPQQEAPAAAPRRKRRTRAEMEAARAAEAAGQEQPQAAPAAPPQAPQQPVPQGPPGTVFVGYTGTGDPIFQAATVAQPASPPPAPPQAPPGAAPWETGAAPLY